MIIRIFQNLLSSTLCKAPDIINKDMIDKKKHENVSKSQYLNCLSFVTVLLSFVSYLYIFNRWSFGVLLWEIVSLGKHTASYSAETTPFTSIYLIQMSEPHCDRLTKVESP